MDLPRRVDKPWGHELWYALTGPGHTWRNQPGEIHTIEDADVLEVSTPEVDDVVRLTDNYGREGTTAR